MIKLHIIPVVLECYLTIEIITCEGSSLISFLDDLRFLFMMLWDRFTGKYKIKVTRTVLALVIGIGYLILPTDLVTDFMLPIGLIDDATVLGMCWYMMQKDLATYRHWKEQSPAEVDYTEE